MRVGGVWRNVRRFAPLFIVSNGGGLSPKDPPPSEAAHSDLYLLSNKLRKLVSVLGRGGWVDQIKTNKKCLWFSLVLISKRSGSGLNGENRT